MTTIQRLLFTKSSSPWAIEPIEVNCLNFWYFVMYRNKFETLIRNYGDLKNIARVQNCPGITMFDSSFDRRFNHWGRSRGWSWSCSWSWKRSVMSSCGKHYPYTAIFSKHTLHLPKPCEFYLYLGDEPVNALKLNVSSQRNPTTKDFDKICFFFKAVVTVKKKVWKLGWTLGQVAWTAFWVIAVVIYGANVWRGWIVWVVQRLLVNIVV